MTPEIQKLIEAHPRPWHVGREVDDKVGLYDANEGWICVIQGSQPGMPMPTLFIANALVATVNGLDVPRSRSFFPKMGPPGKGDGFVDALAPALEEPSFLGIPLKLDPSLPPGTIRVIGTGGNSATLDIPTVPPEAPARPAPSTGSHLPRQAWGQRGLGAPESL